MSVPKRTYANLVTVLGLEKIAKYAQAVGIDKNLLVSGNSSGKLRSPTSLVTDAHAAGLLVHVWTFKEIPKMKAFKPKPHSSSAIRKLSAFELH